MPIESCANFKRFTTSSGESQWCSGAGKNVACAGWSDLCSNKASFIPTGRISLSEVSFERTKISKPGMDIQPQQTTPGQPKAW